MPQGSHSICPTGLQPCGFADSRAFANEFLDQVQQAGTLCQHLPLHISHPGLQDSAGHRLSTPEPCGDLQKTPQNCDTPLVPVTTPGKLQGFCFGITGTAVSHPQGLQLRIVSPEAALGGSGRDNRSMEWVGLGWKGH